MGIQNYMDQIGWGPFVQVDHIFGDDLSMGTEFFWNHLSRGTNFMGIFRQRRQEVRDWKSEDQIGSGPNALQPKIRLELI